MGGAIRRDLQAWEAGHIVAGRYRLLSVVGQGSIGQVWRAEALATGDHVALKALHDKYAMNPKMRIRFGREVLAIHTMRHPHIVSYYDHGVDTDRRPYLVMELIEGRSGAEVVSAPKPLTWPQVLELVRKLCSALGYAHEQGIIHRDLKWANVIVDGSFEIGGPSSNVPIKLIDFGILKFALTSALRDGKRVTDTGVIVGTPYYASPEQILGRPIDGRSDVYSLSVMLYELLCGRKPFVGKNQMRVVLAHLHEPARPPVEVEGAPYPISPALSQAIMSGLAKDPEQRTPSVRALYKLIDRAIPDA